MRGIASHITSLTIVYSTVYSDEKQNKTSKLRVTGLCAGNSPVTGEFPAQMASNAENVSIWWCHHDFIDFIILEYINAYINKDKEMYFVRNCRLFMYLYIQITFDSHVELYTPNQ